MSVKRRDIREPGAPGSASVDLGGLDALADSVLVVGEDARIVEINDAAETLFALTRASAVGRDLAEMVPELAGLLPIRELLESSRAQGGIAAEITGARGAAVPVHLTVSESSSSGRRRYFLVVRDFRRVALAQQQLLRTERLAAIGATMAALAHESRNALQRMQSCLTLIRMRGAPPVLELVDDMQEAQDQLQRLYEEVRSFAAPLKLEPRPSDLRKLVGCTWRQLGLRWRVKDLDWSLDAGEAADTSAWIDPQWIGQALRNVLENAIDAAPARSTVRCSVAGIGDDDWPALQIAVEDSGPGIPDESRERVFDLLYTTKPDGTGMGLAIARRIVDEHLGTMAVERASDGGARVVIELPRQAVT